MRKLRFGGNVTCLDGESGTVNRTHICLLVKAKVVVGGQGVTPVGLWLGSQGSR